MLCTLVCFQATIQFLLGGRNFPGRGNAGGSRKKVEFTELAIPAWFFSVGERREEDAFWLCYSRIAAAVLFVGSGALFVRGPKGVGGEQVPQLSCFSLFLAARLPGAGRSGAGAGCQGQLRSGAGTAFSIQKRQGASGPASASSAVGRGSTATCLGAFWKRRA